MSKWSRFGVFVLGSATFLTGAVATFLNVNATGATTLILVGVFALLCAGVNRWPTKIVVSGNEIDLQRTTEKNKKAIDGKKDTAIENIDQNAQAVLRVLKDLALEANKAIDVLKAEAAPLKSTSRPQAHGAGSAGFSTLGEAQIYNLPQIDQIDLAYKFETQVKEFIEKNIKDVQVQSAEADDNLKPDYELRKGDKSLLYIETKYVTPPITKFLGVTLDEIIKFVSEKGKLLVVTNVEDVEVAREKLYDNFGSDRADVVAWSGPNDDELFLKTIQRLLGSQI